MGLELFNKQSRPQLFRRMHDEQFDVLIIGGGITGASIFRDAVLRGLRAALVEANDFGSGTSGRSSKLIHGGLRYLGSLQFRLAWEASHERNLHTALNGRLVQPWPFLIPMYRGQGWSPVTVRSAMWMYEIMSGFRNTKFHQFLGREETQSMAPGLDAEGLRGGVLYYDAIVSDSRWTLETVKDGVRNGGVALNHAPVTGFSKMGDTIESVGLHDQVGGAELVTRASVVVNATGAWTDRIRKLDRPEAADLVKLSKGTHLVFDAGDVPLNVSIVFNSPVDGRHLFLVKRDDCFLYGTTDDWESTEPDAPAPGEADVAYLLESIRRFLPYSPLGRENVRFCYSGYRALLLPSTGDNDPSSVNREDLIEIAASGLVTVVGGKLTTSRSLASRVLDQLVKKMGSDGWGPCRTHQVPVGGGNEEMAAGLRYWVRRCPRLTGYFQTLYQRYGVDADRICAEATRIFLADGSGSAGDPVHAEVRYICRSEMVCTLQDLVEQRAGFLSWSNEMRLQRLRDSERVICDELEISEDEFEQQYRDYQGHLQRSHTLPEESSTA